MSLVIHLQNASSIKGRGGQQVKMTFRGVTKYSHVVKTSASDATWDETFEWSVDTSIRPDEVMEIVLLTHGKLRRNIAQGTLTIIPEDVVQLGEVRLQEPLLDQSKNKQLETILSLHIQYFSPNDTVDSPSMSESSNQGTGYGLGEDDDIRPLVSSASSESLRRLLKTIGRKGMESGDESEDELTARMSVIYGQNPDIDESRYASKQYQVNITVLEARQLAGVDISPAVCVSVGDTKKYTASKTSTNSPFFNELFVFDFDCPQDVFFDNIITIEAVHSHTLLTSGTVIGQFKLDVGTLYTTPDRSFYHKWAILVDPKDINGGVKGYVKVDMSIVGRNDMVKSSQVSLEDEDNVDSEVNLLLPQGIKADRPMGKFIVKIYRAEGLPIMNSVMLANVKKVFTGSIKDLVDPFVQVTFAGQKGRTECKKNKYDPIWNEQIEFTEMFPPLCRRIKVEVRDNDEIGDELIGTTFIELEQIGNDSNNGFLPTFGPSWINLYGSVRGYSTLRENGHLDEGDGEGCMYRGRLLVAVKAEVADSSHQTGAISVDVSPTLPISETAAGRQVNFFLFGCVIEASLIDTKIGDKPISFELSIGNHGNYLDGAGTTVNTLSELFGLDGPVAEQSTKAAKIHSMTTPIKPVTDDKLYYYMPYGDVKPCVDVTFSWEDHLRRIYDQNILHRIIDTLEKGLSKVNEMISKERGKPERKLRKIMEQFSLDCSEIPRLTGKSMEYRAGKTNLDKERYEYMLKEVETIAKKAYPTRKGSQAITADNVEEKLKEAYGMLKHMYYLADEPQGNLPDVFIWMISGDKRIAYHRIPARKLLYSPEENERGVQCGQMQTLLLRLPGKRGTGKNSWTSKCKLQMYLWLSKDNERQSYLNGLLEGYEVTSAIASSNRTKANVHRSINFKEKHPFQLRAHMYQARGLIASDDSGLSDPFTRIMVGNQCKQTHVTHETLNPTWNETVVFEKVDFYGSPLDVKRNPPMITVEMCDKDNTGKAEFIGRGLANPVIKLITDAYEKPEFPPALEWFGLYRGQMTAGDFLAAFELIEFNNDVDEIDVGLPNLKAVQRNRKSFCQRDTDIAIPIPENIRPILCRYRLEILFWGMRDLKSIQMFAVNRPRVDIECAGHVVSSSVIENIAKNPNFPKPVKYIDVDLPEEDIYCPPITIRVVDCRNFGRFTLVGTHTIKSLQKFKYTPKWRKVHSFEGPSSSLSGSQAVGLFASIGDISPIHKYQDSTTSLGKEVPLVRSQTTAEPDGQVPSGSALDSQSIKALSSEDKPKRMHQDEPTVINMPGTKLEQPKDEDLDKNQLDWWSKYSTSKNKMIHEQRRKNKGEMSDSDEDTDYEEPDDKTSNGTWPSFPSLDVNFSNADDWVDPGIATFKIYPCELEKVPEFNGFNEWLHNFDLHRGKNTSDSEDDTKNALVGAFRGSLALYKMPLPEDLDDVTPFGTNPAHGYFNNLPSNDPLKVMVRVYVVRAIDLHAADINSKADPYLVVKLGKQTFNEKENYISKQLNPIFGKCFEFEALFPQESMLTVQVHDYDLIGFNDLIGETKVDLEKRYYSKHRATCGLSETYATQGYNAWRDAIKPTQILHKLCKSLKIDQPVYENGTVRICGMTFTGKTEVEDENGRKTGTYEHLALEALKHWDVIPTGCKLVPEHVETRSLFLSDKPGIQQGKLEMWIDMFPRNMPLPGAPVDITPRKPKRYELRVIIWNTLDVILEDKSVVMSEKMSDIYVKGWILEDDVQSTDVHYRSLTGEGNFNWRFIFPFEYLASEEKIVFMKKESKYAIDETEYKIPPRLNLQVWDNDSFSANDILGSLVIDLNRFPRGAKDSKQCNLKMLQTDESVPLVSMFKLKRMKGFWPFSRKIFETEMTGKVEAEFILMTEEEAEKSPAGLGRKEPEPLEKPNRPDSSFVFFTGPLKTLEYLVCVRWKRFLIKLTIVGLLLLLVALFIYSMPGYTVKKMFGA